jgi:pyruvate dehydrogenase (quinone)
MSDDTADLPRRRLLKSSVGAGAGFLAGRALAAGDSVSAGADQSGAAGNNEQQGDRVSGAHELSKQSETTADLLVDGLISWGVAIVFGLVGDGINPIIEALRKRENQIRFIAVRHEEAAAFMAGGYAKHTGKLGVCLATTGPGAIHLLNGLYDAKMDSTPVLAITGTTFHDLGGIHFMQAVDTVALMKDVAVFNVQVSGPVHAKIVVNVACRAALSGRGVAHLTIAKDTQAMPLQSDKPSMENHGLQTASHWDNSSDVPGTEQLKRAADVLNRGRKVAILVGQGALRARAEVLQLADKLGAPVAKALLGKAVLPDDSAFTTGGIGHLGTLPTKRAMEECDTLLILGSTMPWIDAYPTPGQARAVQVDLNGKHIGLRYPVELGLVGDVKATLAALLPFIQVKRDREFLTTAQSRMREWNALLDRVAQTARTPLRPQMVVRAVSDALAPDAVISLDCGANTHFAARMLRLKEGQSLTGTGLLATMAPGLPFAIAAQLAFPRRQSVAIVGDGGFSQLMAELVTAVKYQLPIKVIILKNNSLAEVRFEQEELGNPSYGCELAAIDFVAFAKSCGAEGFRCSTPSEVVDAVRATLHSPGVAVLEAIVDADEKPAMPDELKV